MVNIKNKVNNITINNQLTILSEFYWIETLIRYRIQELCQVENLGDFPQAPVIHTRGVHPYFDFLLEEKVDLLERISLSLSLISQTFPKFLDAFYTYNQIINQPFKEFGIHFKGELKILIPTWQTAFFLYLGTNIEEQLRLIYYNHSDHRLYRTKVLIRTDESQENPFLTPLQLHKDKLNEWIYGKNHRNLASHNFAAHEISSKLNWEDLFMTKETEVGLQQLKQWFKHGKKLQNNPKFSKNITAGVRVLFYGPSGTGKTLTASLLGKEFNLPVYRVDLSQMVSKWIGETEKNLANIFDLAEQKNWILFFDEADALFSNRGVVKSSNDRRSNQEISYLLQRVENYDGSIIMATNLKDNIDDAFIRRFQLMIHFPIPNTKIRTQLWNHLLTNTFPIHSNVELTQIAADYELTGGNMKNIFRTLMLDLYDTKVDEQIITEKKLRQAIKQELVKNGYVSVAKRY